METPSSKNGSYLVIAVGIMALVSLVIGVMGLIKARAAEKQLADLTQLSVQVQEAKSAADDAKVQVTNLNAKTARALDAWNSEISAVRTSLNRVQSDMKTVADKIVEMEARPAPVASSSGGSGASTPRGPAPGTLAEDGTYVIKQGDTFGKLSREWGCSIQDIERANPGVSSTKLRIGQKIVVPKK